jgi:cell division protease FtsH
VNLETIAKRTPGFTGADLANLVNESALMAARKGRNEVTMADVEVATDRIIAGLEKRNRVLNEKEKRIVAFHETGHALMAYLRPTAEKVHKISIVPRGIGSLGFTLQLPTEDRYLMSKTELLEKIDVLLGGRAAEQIIFNDITTGAQNDLQRATEIARSMVTMYGMTEILGPVTYQPAPNPYLAGQPFAPPKEISEKTAKMIDDEIRAIVEERMKGVLITLEGRRDLLHQVATKLLEIETLEAEAFLDVVRLVIPEEPAAVKAL